MTYEHSIQVLPSSPDAPRQEIARLQGEVRDLQAALLASNEHAGLLEKDLHRLSVNFTAEVREREAAEEKLQKLVKAITKEKCDLEILVQILSDQGDISAEEGEKARIDGLVQLANRRRFDEYLSKEWKRHALTQKPLSLLFCDIDHFKLYNDHYGHQAGDQCLKVVAAAINKCFRGGDLVARYGGEEFAMVLPHTSLAVAALVAERVRATVEATALPHAASPVCVRVTVSIGVACTTPQLQDATDGSTLIEAADQNLYLAKQLGRNRVNYQSEEKPNHDD